MPTSRDAAAGRQAPATITEVADRAEVSRQTVSNVVNGTGRVGEQTRTRVLTAIAELGYTPNHAAASLRSGRVGRLAYLLPADGPRPENTIMLDFLHHLVTASARRRLQVLVVPQQDVDGLVRSRSVDAAVLSAVGPRDPRVGRVRRLGVPFVCFGRTGATEPQCWVDVDDELGVRRATEAVIARGHRTIAFVGYESTRHWDRARQAGYVAAMAAAGLRRRIVTVDAERPANSVARLLRRPNPPSAVISGSDVLAAAAYSAAVRLGLTVGRDLAVVGFDGTNAARLLAPSLATVGIPLDRIAGAIVARLLGETPNDVGEVFEPQWRPGESLGQPRTQA